MGDRVQRVLHMHLEKSSPCSLPVYNTRDSGGGGGGVVVNGMSIIPGEKIIFTAWRKHFNTFLLKDVLPLEPE